MGSSAAPFAPIRFALAMLFVFSLCFSAGSSFAAQGPAHKTAAEQREAMRKLSFLAGRWSGPCTVFAGPGRTLHLTQTENVRYKLDGLVMLVEGHSTNSARATVFSALATIAYDDASHAYHIRAYNDGHYVDTELTVAADGFSWAFDAGPAHVINTMHLTANGQWHETSQASFRGGPPHPSVEMTLSRVR